MMYSIINSMMNVGIKFSNSGSFSNDNVIDNELKYIFSYPIERYPNRKPKPIHYYGTPFIGYPPDIDKLIMQFKLIRQLQNNTISQQVWHFHLHFPIVFPSVYEPYFYFADSIAKLFSHEYPIAYAYHTENKTSKNNHSHFHYIVSTSSYISDYPALDAQHLIPYLLKMPEIAKVYNITLSHHQSQEELQCLNLMKIF